MKDILRAGCELLVENRDAIHKNFIWDMEMMSITGSVILTGAGKTADIEKMKECKAILKKHKGAFSEFRQNMETPIICKMSLAEDPEKYLMDLSAVYDKLSKGKIFGSEYLVLTALAICDGKRENRVEDIIAMTKELLKRMSKEHPMLTSDEDMTFAALLIMKGKSLDEIIDETEYCYEYMKKKFTFHGNAVQSLSHVLTLCEGMPEEKCRRASAIYDALLTRKISYGKDYELATLGALVNIDMTPEELADEIADASEYLKTCKGFGDWSIGTKTRTMFAALLAAQAYAPVSIAMDASVIGTSLAMVIAEEACLMVTMMACTTSSN